MTWELPEGAATAVCPSVPRIGALSSKNYKPVISLPWH